MQLVRGIAAKDERTPETTKVSKLRRRSPLDVMRDNMAFWDEKAKEIAEQMDQLVIPEGDAATTRQALRLLGELLACRDKAQACANDLAPYTHSRLMPVAGPPPSPDELEDDEPAPRREDYSDPSERAALHQRIIRGLVK